MAALRWGLGAAGLGRALRPGGRHGVSSDEGTVRRLWRRGGSSSARACEQEPRKDWGHAELLEVLEARERQLQERHPEGPEEDVAVLGGRWAQKVASERHLVRWQQQQQQEQEPVCLLSSAARLRLRPRLQDQALSQGLARLVEEPAGPWEEQLEYLLRRAPQRQAAGAQGPERATQRPKGNALQQRLLGFLECCQLSGHQALAHHVLESQHSRFRQPPLITLPMYNIVLRGWARKGSFRELLYVFYMLRDSGLTPDLASYAAVLQCLGRLDRGAGSVRRCLKQMEQDGLQLQDLFSQPALEDRERQAILSAVRKALPDFRPLPPPQAPLGRCSAQLLADFYAGDQPAHYPRLHLSQNALHKLFQEQLRVEMATIVQVPSVDRSPEDTPQLHRARNMLNALRQQWEEALLQGLREAKVVQAQMASEGNPSVYPHLCLLSEDELVQLLLQRLHALSPHGDSLLSVAQELGMRVFTRFTVQRQQLSRRVQELEQRYHSYLRLLAADGKVKQPQLPRQFWESLGPSEPWPEQPWPVSVLVQLGKVLAEVLVQAVHMPHHLISPGGAARSVPVLYHAYAFRSFRQIGVLKPHPAFVELLEVAAERTLTFDANQVPMRCPPLPWLSPHMGGYLLSTTKLMRSVETTTQHQHLLAACAPGELHGALDTLTQLGNCAWRVNGPVLDLVLALFQDQGCPKLGVPAPVPRAPHACFPRLPPGTPPAHKAKLRSELARALKLAREQHGLRADALYRLSVAQHLRDHTFWLPHNMDFRGRTYPCPPHFNHLGSDLARALLQFAQGRPLGARGLDWLKIHLVNLTGLKKRESLRGRLAFADTILDLVLDSADRPMKGQKWWMEAEEPWQTLACCMEIASALRSPDPAAYVSHFPVHQDGSCNGLQHYAALGRDAVGGAAVNLVPAELPQDVYSEVAAQVEVLRKRDAERGLQVAQKLEGFISRKVVKQTVMTVVYGVTRYGGRLQIEKRLRELEAFPQESVWEASHYLACKVFSSLQEMFCSSRAIQNWLTQAATLISRSGSPVQWVTPLGVPVIQPYHVDSKIMVTGGMQTLTISSSGDMSQKPNTMKQKNGFPPNFIHSLDSSHMMLTALHCYRKGLNFVSVHDCFWTHAADVEVMNEVCREQFVRLHSQPILRDLAAFLQRRFCSEPWTDCKPTQIGQRAKLQRILQAVPETGSLDLEQVKRSTYFFS
ncbi:DNA-directed RNA polymerase, mitochondrial [Erinaceus europaeus]|uniref:DNA-directed RNA polymerase n=1 Tax=Erinaceus europaeus TaxID=9365 RepID=A0ABM3WLG2_ERIEU|nr:DNA-directed RNA polymerase, mitochondrial [Erinaceus europaeus]